MAQAVYTTIAEVERAINAKSSAMRAMRSEIGSRYQDTFGQSIPARIRLATDIELMDLEIAGLYRRKRELAAALTWDRPTTPDAVRAPARETDWLQRALRFRGSMRLTPSQFKVKIPA